MSDLLDVFPPGQPRTRHAGSGDFTELDVNYLPGGGVQVIGIFTSNETRSQHGQITRTGENRRTIIATYPPGTKVQWL